MADDYNLTPEERKELIKEAIKEWMDTQKLQVESAVGRWVIRGIAIAAVIALVTFILWINGWHKLM